MRQRLLGITLAAALLVGGPAAAAMAAPGPNGNNNRGLCTAYFNGSEKGREKKRKAPPFVALEEAAEAQDQTVEEFCAGLIGGKPDRRG